MIKNGVNTVYSYNAEKNRLVSVRSNNYTYDANGNITSDGTYTYGWGDDNKLKEVKQGTTSIASFTGKPIFMNYLGNQYWYHYDQHGNVIRMTDVNGNTVATYNYDAWGNITNQWGAIGREIVDLNPFRYSGYWYDKDTGKYYLKARFYDSQIGRFLSKDPIAIRVADKLSLNAYVYADNNPVKYVDPNGTFVGTLLWAAAIVAPEVVIPIVAIVAVIGLGVYVATHLSKKHSGSLDDGYSHPSDVSSGTGDVAEAAPDASHGDNAYEKAKNGGKHEGTYKKYRDKPIDQIKKSIKSFNKQIKEHERKINNPKEELKEDWDKLDPRHQEDLINRKWPSDIKSTRILSIY